MQSGFVVLPTLCFSLPFSLYLFGSTLGLSDPIFVASFFSHPFGYSPNSAPSSGAAHTGSVIDPNPLCSLPPCHLSARHIIVFIHLARVLLFSFLCNALLFSSSLEFPLRSHLFLLLFPPFLFTLFSEPLLFSRLPCSSFLFALFSEPPFFSRLLRSPFLLSLSLSSRSSLLSFPSPSPAAS